MGWFEKFRSKIVMDDPVTEEEIKEVEDALEDQRLQQEIEDAAAEVNNDRLICTEGNLADAVAGMDKAVEDFMGTINEIREVKPAVKVAVRLFEKSHRGSTHSCVRFTFDGDPFSGAKYAVIYLSDDTLVFNPVENKIRGCWCIKTERRGVSVAVSSEDKLLAYALESWMDTDNEGYMIPTEYTLFRDADGSVTIYKEARYEQ